MILPLQHYRVTCIMIPENTRIVILVLSLWITEANAAKYFHPTNQVGMHSSTLSCVEVLCRSRVHAGVQCFTMTPGCRGIWFIDDLIAVLRSSGVVCATVQRISPTISTFWGTPPWLWIAFPPYLHVRTIKHATYIWLYSHRCAYGAMLGVNYTSYYLIKFVSFQ